MAGGPVRSALISPTSRDGLGPKMVSNNPLKPYTADLYIGDLTSILVKPHHTHQKARPPVLELNIISYCIPTCVWASFQLEIICCTLLP